MFRSTIVAGQIWCLALSHSNHATKMTLWPDSSRIIAMSGYKFSYGTTIQHSIPTSDKILINLILECG